MSALPGLRGSLLAPGAAAEWLRGMDATSTSATVARWAAASATLGPSSSERRLLDALVGLFESCGFDVRPFGTWALAATNDDDVIGLAATRYGRRPGPSRAVLAACMDARVPWVVTFNGQSLALTDARAGSSRRTAIIALDDLAARADAAALTGALFEPHGCVSRIADAVSASDESSLAMQRGLRTGVDEALTALCRALPFEAGVHVLFRLLFVLFAEARALVPTWHATYRDHYALASLVAARGDVPARGTWAALEAGRRLLGEGCRAGTLDVPAFNGRLFAPSGVRRWARSAALDSPLDEPAHAALMALATYRPGRGGARRVQYADLGVEELGAIYERVMDRDPSAQGRARKESGSFYTPRSLTMFLVRRTLAPLVDGATSDRILALRIVDPAMGSGAFLVAALRYLADALERALVAEGRLPEADVTDADRRDLRRLIAQRCLFGVDLNPTAVMLAKLSLWLATLSSGRPLTFLDHRLKRGNSLIGVDPYRAARPPGLRTVRRLPLFDPDVCRDVARAAATGSTELASMPEHSLDDVRRKERMYATLASDRSALARLQALCDAWCAWWFLPQATRPDAREFSALADALTRRTSALPSRRVNHRLQAVRDASGTHVFFHWPLEFPDVFPEGFDAVIGNPPWEMLRAGGGSHGRDGIKTFARSSGVFSIGTGGHLNLYQLFIERALQIVRPGGRVGLVLPWGVMCDEGAASLRQRLIDGTAIDTCVRLDNAAALFEAHRSIRFAALTTTNGRSTASLHVVRAHGAASLDGIPDAGAPGDGAVITRAGLTILGGPALRVPDAANARDLALAVKLASTHRALGDPEGWGASFGRELNLTDDREHFVLRGRSTLPVLEGKHIGPFSVDVAGARHHVHRACAKRLLPQRPFDRARLAYRDVTAQGNRQTLIAAIVPAGCVTGHSLFCLRGHYPAEVQRALCVILNSTVANFLVRLFVGAHITTALIAWLPVPGRAAAVAALGDVASSGPGVERIVARLYGLTSDERELVRSGERPAV